MLSYSGVSHVSTHICIYVLSRHMCVCTCVRVCMWMCVCLLGKCATTEPQPWPWSLLCKDWKETYDSVLFPLSFWFRSLFCRGDRLNGQNDERPEGGEVGGSPGLRALLLRPPVLCISWL